MSRSQLSCELHDYIEIACLYGYRVKLTLSDGQTVIGSAQDTRTTADKKEYLIVGDDQIVEIETNRIAKLEVLTPNAKFSQVVFDDGGERLDGYQGEIKRTSSG